MSIRKIGAILYQSLLDTLTGQLWKWLIGGSGSLFGILLFAKNFLNKTIEKSIHIGIVILVSVFVIRYFLFLSANIIKWAHFRYKESIYGNTICILRDSFSKIHSLKRKTVIDDKEFIEVMVYLCNNLKKIFDEKTKKECSVSIKVPTKGSIKEQTVVLNLCRDSIASKIRDTESYRKVEHTIIGNTAYHKILNNILKGNKDKLFYINNDINSNSDYENTSREAYLNGVLPYSSELVYPIIPYSWDRNTNNSDCMGFICVDCNSKNAFDDKYDVAIISGVADVIYDLITLRNNQKEQKDDKNK